MTLPHLLFPADIFDCVTANFVINHLDDPRAAMRELARVTRPEGRVAVTIWTSQPTAQSTLFADSLAAAGTLPVSGQRLPADLDFERSVNGLSALAIGACLKPLIARELDGVWTTTWDALWTGIAGGVASIGQTYLVQDAAVRRRIESEMRTRAGHLEVNGSLTIQSKAAYVVATSRPSGVRPRTDLAQTR